MNNLIFFKEEYMHFILKAFQFPQTIFNARQNFIKYLREEKSTYPIPYIFRIKSNQIIHPSQTCIFLNLKNRLVYVLNIYIRHYMQVTNSS